MDRLQNEEAAEANEEEQIEARRLQKTSLIDTVNDVKRHIKIFQTNIEKAVEELVKSTKKMVVKSKDVDAVYELVIKMEDKTEGADERKKFIADLVASQGEELKRLIKMHIQTEAKRKAIEDVLSVVQNWNADDLKSLPPDAEHELQERFAKTDEDPSEADLFSSKLYTERWKKSLGALVGDDADDDDVVVDDSLEIDIPSHCPLTRGEMADPLRSKVCKHIISKSGVDQLYINKRKNATVPCIICKKPNLKTDFVFDNELREAWEEAQKKRQRDKEMSQFASYGTQAVE